MFFEVATCFLPAVSQSSVLFLGFMPHCLFGMANTSIELAVNPNGPLYSKCDSSQFNILNVLEEQSCDSKKEAVR